MSTSTTSTELVNALYVNFGTLIEDMIPLFYLVFGLFLFLFGFGILIKALRGGIRKVGK